jgi:2-polyprenyl-3-methyl-5-hydroxy-6-metoxy-1,4-benzoquinol methylase
MVIQAHQIDQSRWDTYGRQRLEDLAQHRERHLVRQSPTAKWMAHEALMGALGSLRGQRVLEFGCGWGRFAVYMAQQGAQVDAIDVGPDLVAAGRLLAQVNQVECVFHVMDAAQLAFGDGAFDLVVGLSVLHHLPQELLARAMGEVARVLRPGGKAVFYEPVENSKVFNFLQNLFPAGDPESTYYRPSILRRKAWKQYLEKLDDRDLTDAEINALAHGFSSCRSQHFGLSIRLVRLVGERFAPWLNRCDTALLRRLPPLRYYSQNVLVEYTR